MSPSSKTVIRLDDATAELKVRFGEPRAGWLSFTISTSVDQFNEIVSHTPNDFLLELATALSLVLQGTDGMATVSCEPTTYDLRFSLTHPDTVDLQITKFPSWKRIQNESSVVLSITGTKLQIILPFWRGLRDLEGRLEAEEFRTAFLRAFPSSCVQRLTRLVGQLPTQ